MSASADEGGFASHSGAEQQSVSKPNGSPGPVVVEPAGLSQSQSSHHAKPVVNLNSQGSLAPLAEVVVHSSS